jgi:hypothetical protein
MYAGVIASAVHDALRHGLAIAVVHGPTNLLRTAHEEGDYFGTLHHGIHWRLIQMDYVLTQFGGGSQNNFRFSTGILLKF